jgi:hypothetical protein
MGMGLIYGIFILIILSFCAPIIYIFLRKKGKPKLGMLIASIIILFVISCYFTNDIDQTLYSKSDVKMDLKMSNLYLKDDFEILKNKVDGMPERFQDTEIQITETDKERIISEIKNGKNFKKSQKSRILYDQTWNENGIKNKVVFTDYYFNEQFIRESYYRKDEYVPILMIVSLSENSNILKFSRIED